MTLPDLVMNAIISFSSDKNNGTHPPCGCVPVKGRFFSLSALGLFLGSGDRSFAEFLHGFLDFEGSLACACAGSLVSLFSLKACVF